MSQFFKGIALFVAVTFIIWVTVLWRWQATSRDMTVTAIVVYLGVLPVVVFALLLGLRWAWRGAEPRREAALQAAAAQRMAPAAARPAAATADEAERHAVAKLLSAQVACAAGSTPEELLTAATELKPRPDFDDALRDGEGLAVMCARMELQAEGTIAALEPIVVAHRAQRPEWATLELAEHVPRAIAALAGPLRDAVLALQPWAGLLGVADRDASRFGAIAADAGASAERTGRITGIGASARPASPALVRVLLGWPASWSEFEQAVAAEWARQDIAAATEIPAPRFAFAAHAGSGEDLWLKADQLLLSLARERRQDVVLVAACHSDLSDAAVDALEQAQRLFSAEHRPRGLMPGEAAAALVLAAVDWPDDPDSYLPPVRLHRPAVGRRDKSIESGAGRVSSERLQDVATQALTAGRLAPEAVPKLACDADQHTQRGTELFGTTLALLPHLDPGEDMALTGTVTGHTGAVGTLLVIAAAAERARTSNEPCLALAVGDTLLRLAVLARPGTEAAAAPAATT